MLPISGAKNSALKVMAAALLSDEPLTLANVPRLADVDMLLRLLEQHGASVDFHGSKLKLHAKDIASTEAPYDLVRKMRASFNVLGPLLAREGKAKVSLPGGCAIGARPVDLHLKALTAMGAKISGAGTSKISVEGVERLHAAEHSVLPDRIETGAYAMAVAATGGELTLTGTRADLLGAAWAAMEEAGVEMAEVDNGIRIRRNGAGCKAVDIVTQPFPGFPTDLQAQFMALMATADGVSTIKETIFENRFMHAPELGRMGAKISVDGQTATVRGVSRLKGAPVMATDLRASMSLIIAGLAAEGQTMVNRVYHLDRGFERLEEKLQACGALIERVKE